MSGNWVVGVLINIVGACTTNLGTVLMKYHVQKRNGVGIWKKVGILLFSLGTVMTFASFSFAAQSLLAGISAVQFVSNLFFVNWLLDEPYSWKNVIGTLVLIVGIVVLVLASEKNSISDDVDTFFDEFYFTVEHLIFFICILVFAAFFSGLFWFRTGTRPFWIHKSNEERLAFEMSLPRSQTNVARFLLPLLYLCIAAMIGGQSVVSGKVLSLIAAACLGSGEWSQLYQPRTFLVLSLWLFFALVWVIHLNRALRIFYGAFIIPLTQVNWTLWTMISGGVVYKEFQAMAGWQISLFVIGTLTLFFGVSLLVPPRKSEALLASESADDVPSISVQLVSPEAPPPGAEVEGAKSEGLVRIWRHSTAPLERRVEALSHEDRTSLSPQSLPCAPERLASPTQEERNHQAALSFVQRRPTRSLLLFSRKKSHEHIPEGSQSTSTPPGSRSGRRFFAQSLGLQPVPRAASAEMAPIPPPAMVTPQSQRQPRALSLEAFDGSQLHAHGEPEAWTGFTGMYREISSAMSVDCIQDNRSRQLEGAHASGEIFLEDPDAVGKIVDPPFIRMSRWLRNRKREMEEKKKKKKKTQGPTLPAIEEEAMEEGRSRGERSGSKESAESGYNKTLNPTELFFQKKPKPSEGNGEAGSKVDGDRSMASSAPRAAHEQSGVSEHDVIVELPAEEVDNVERGRAEESPTIRKASL